MITGSVYKLTNTTTQECYIGSTCIPVEVRLYQHRMNASRAKSSSHKLFSDPDHEVIVETLEHGQYNDRQALNKREYELMSEHANTVNRKRIQCVNQSDYIKEYYKQNKDKFRKSNREYQRRHKKRCECCNTSISPNSWQYHINSPKHLTNFIHC